MRDQRFQSTSTPRVLSKKWRNSTLLLLGLALILASVSLAFPRLFAAQADQRVSPANSDWPTYMYGVGRSGFNQAETVINRTSASKLQLHWTIQSGGKIFSQPIVANGMVYWGSFDGYEHAANLSGQQIWQQYLGARTTCVTYNPLGVVSSAAVATVQINGTATSVVFVAGGDDHLYALDALTGAIIWSTAIGDSSTNTFIWDSPLVINNNVYIGSATTGEGAGTQCKVIPGQFSELNASTGSIMNTFNTVPPGCAGGGVWSSPTYDASDGSIYFTAGTQGNCNDHISVGIVKLRASDLTYLDSWQIPLSQRLTNDADFAGTPTLFTATINGTKQTMVGAADKNGLFYAFNRASLSSGPVWSTVIAVPGACPQCGKGSISSAVYDGIRLLVAGGNTTINGVSCGGSIQALDPATGIFLWQTCLPKTVLGALTEVPGVVALIDGAGLVLLNAMTGSQLYTRNGAYYGSPSISNGVLYSGSTTGKLYAFGP
jgi:polyvinyl alcohol dehydrogenase (cytochrome)